MTDEPRADDRRGEAAQDTADTDPTSGGAQSSQLDDSLRDIQELVGGLAARLLGPKAARKLEIDPEKPVISPEVDRALEDLGESLGRFLTRAGTEIRRASGVAEATQEPADTGPPSDESNDLEGWSPLVIGARTFAESLGSVAADVIEKVSQRAAAPGDEE